MVAGPAAGDAVARALRLPSLRVGLHLVLVEGRPILPEAEIDGLVRDDGEFDRMYVVTLTGTCGATAVMLRYPGCAK